MRARSPVLLSSLRLLHLRPPHVTPDLFPAAKQVLQSFLSDFSFFSRKGRSLSNLSRALRASTSPVLVIGERMSFFLPLPAHFINRAISTLHIVKTPRRLELFPFRKPSLLPFGPSASPLFLANGRLQPLKRGDLRILPRFFFSFLPLGTKVFSSFSQ